jgi:hypothetical protein
LQTFFFLSFFLSLFIYIIISFFSLLLLVRFPFLSLFHLFVTLLINAKWQHAFSFRISKKTCI